MGSFVAARRLFLFTFLVACHWALATDESWLGRVAPLHLDSETQANALADELIQKFNEENPEAKTVDVFHVEGLSVSPYLQTVLTRLHTAGYKVQGTFLSREKLEKIEAENPAARIQYTAESMHDLRSVKESLFGLPQGLTFFSHFFQGKSWKWKYGFDTDVFQLARNTTGLAMLTTVLMRTIAFPFFGAPNPNPAELTVTTSLLGAWIFHFMNFRREWGSFRTQGCSVVVNPGAPETEQIRVGSNPNLFTTACVTQEHILSTILVGVMTAFGTIPMPKTLTELGSLILGTSFLSTISAFSYTSFEEVMAGRIKEAEKVSSTDPEKAQEIRKGIGFLSNVFYNVLYPIANYTGRFLPGILANIPLASLGFGAWWWKKSTSGAKGLLAKNDLSKTVPQDLACSAVISLNSSR